MKINNPKKYAELDIDKAFEKLNDNLKSMDINKYGSLSQEE